MAESPFENTAVPLSHTLGVGTVGHRPFYRDNAGTSAGAVDLKALARLVLARDSKRDTLSHDNPIFSAAAGQSDQAIPAAETALTTGGCAEPAAIVEHDNNIPRDWTEGFARLDPDRPPFDMPSARWRTFIADLRLFLDGPFCATAVAIGWDALDLFGCDSERPFARVDKAGLLLLLGGKTLVALTADTATIENVLGARQTYRRKSPGEPSRVLAWRLAGFDLPLPVEGGPRI